MSGTLALVLVVLEPMDALRFCFQLLIGNNLTGATERRIVSFVLVSYSIVNHGARR